MQDTIITLLHNPRCSKSREALAMLESRGIDADIRLYLQSPLNSDELSMLISRLQQPKGDLIRATDARKHGLSANPASMSEDEICIWLAKHPECMQRPVLIVGEHAAIGRPPETILPLIDNAQA